MTVSFDLRGNEYKGRYFVSLSAYKVETVEPSIAPVTPVAGVPGDSFTPPVDQDTDIVPF